jgi:hypothetical protein
MANLETYGDLKQLLNSVSKRQKGEKIISKGKEFALDQILGLIPGASNAKTAFDFIKTFTSKPDDKKTNTWLDKLDVDDDMSKIVDDTVENGFMQAMTKSIESEQDTKPLEDNFNMNAKMVDYLKKTYSGRTVSGIQENNMKERFQQLAGIKEATSVAPATTTSTTTTPTTSANPNKPDSGVATISKDLDDQGSNFKNIATKEKMEQLLDALTSKLRADFKETPAFKQAILAFYNKNK